MDIGEWLRGLGLEQYQAAFRENEIDGEILPKLTAEDLKDLGVAIVGHRRKILTANAELTGSSATPAQVAPPTAEPAPPAAVAERRQLTVMFCDLVGSTPLSTRPRRVSKGLCQRCDRVWRLGRQVYGRWGAGLFRLSGSPRGRPRAGRPRRACADRRDGRDAISVPLRPQVRVGIATGLVVVGELIGQGSAQERVAVGETLNLAARIQAVASPDSVVVSELTHRLAGAAFDYEALGLHGLKGFTDARGCGASQVRAPRGDASIAGLSVA
jgi:class 3 adenylate cyclase